MGRLVAVAADHNGHCRQLTVQQQGRFRIGNIPVDAEHHGQHPVPVMVHHISIHFPRKTLIQQRAQLLLRLCASLKQGRQIPVTFPAEGTEFRLSGFVQFPGFRLLQQGRNPSFLLSAVLLQLFGIGFPLMLPPGQFLCKFIQPLHQKIRIQRLEQIIGNAQTHSLYRILKIIVPAEDQKPGVRQLLPYFFQKFQPVHVGHGNICHNAVRQKLFGHFHRLAAVASRANNLPLRAVSGDELLQSLPDIRLIICTQNLEHPTPSFPVYISADG